MDDMAKFDMSKIKGMEAGAGLLNSASKMQKSKEMEMIFVMPNKIDFAEENKGISINAIDELADAIADVGLINPIVVWQKEDGRYKIVAGERRYRAINKLIEDGRWNEDRPIKCSLFDPDKVDLALSDEDKEEYVRITENAEQRNKTDGDKLREMRKLKSLYEKLRKNGELSGIKTRTLLANDMKMGESSVAQLQKIENKGSEELIGAVLDDKMSISTAVDIANLPKVEQKDIVEKVLEENPEGSVITKKDVLKVQRKQEDNKTEIPGEEKEERRITTKTFRKDISVITKALKAEESGILLDDKQYMSYLKSIRALEKIIGNV